MLDHKLSLRLLLGVCQVPDLGQQQRGRGGGGGVSGVRGGGLLVRGVEAVGEDGHDLVPRQLRGHAPAHRDYVQTLGLEPQLICFFCHFLLLYLEQNFD